MPKLFIRLNRIDHTGIENLFAAAPLTTQVLVTTAVRKHYTNGIGDKYYELSNHLNNVLQVIKDRKLPFNSSGTVAAFKPDVTSYSDYYPYGMQLPNRHAEDVDYRYSFQGQEHDDEIKGDDNSLNYEYRMHDPRIGRFFATDPLAGDYPYLTPYQFSSNQPMHAPELDGMESSRELIDDPTPKKMSPDQHAQYKKGQYAAGIAGLIMLDIVFAKGTLTKLTILELYAQNHLKNMAYMSGDQTLIDGYEKGTLVMPLVPRPSGSAVRSAKVLPGDDFATVISKREKLAEDFLEVNGATDLDRHLEAIDFNSPVKTKIYPEGTKFYRWSQKSTTESKEFFFTDKATIPGEVGKSTSMYRNPENYVLEEFTLTKPVKVLQSKVNLDGRPGATQMYSPQIQKNATVKQGEHMSDFD